MIRKVKTRSFELALYSAGDQRAKKFALVLPGRLDTKDYAHMKSLVDFLATKEFFALSLDPPGTWESKGSIDLYTTTNYLRAIDEVIDHFGNRPTLLLGHSRGGTTAILTAKTNPTVTGVVAIMANYSDPSPPSLKDFYRGYKLSKRDLPPGVARTSKQKKFRLPIGYFTDGANYDALTAFQSLTIPKLLLYGTHDEFTNSKREQEIFDSLPEPKMLHELNAVHDYRYQPEVMEEVNRIIAKFLTTF